MSIKPKHDIKLFGDLLELYICCSQNCPQVKFHVQFAYNLRKSTNNFMSCFGLIDKKNQCSLIITLLLLSLYTEIFFPYFVKVLHPTVPEQCSFMSIKPKDDIKLFWDLLNCTFFCTQNCPQVQFLYNLHTICVNQKTISGHVLV